MSGLNYRRSLLFAFLHLAIAVPLIVVLPVLSCLVAAQSNSSETAQQTFQKFWNLEVQGGRLTPEGRAKVANFFEDRLPRANGTMRFRVVSNTWKIDENNRESGSDRAVFYVAFTEYGEIREDLRFIRTPSRTAGGVWVKETEARYVLVFSDRHWEFTNDGPKEIRGNKRWFIRSREEVVIVSLDAAIRYVSDIQSRSTDVGVRKSAANSLVVLKRLKLSERPIGR